ncbi:MAG: histidine--tRNA ligase [Clostridia bacterium]|nr:histidine--tRNA ligase [Clostridia bacterium]
MGFIKTPVKGMNDFLPREMELRQKVLSMIRETYATFGFREIETPCMEHIENLTGKQGGENEKLIFKVLKRGAALSRALEKGDDLADSGMRYDLTLPLSRFYAANSASLPSPFKALQIGNVWRADQPQKGRFRQFTQCDIDILGDGSILSEIELVSATGLMLSRILENSGIGGFTIHLNDRRILRAMALSVGFPEEKLESVFIILDKLDKIGPSGVKEELLAEGLEENAVDSYISLFEKEAVSVKEFCANLSAEELDPKVVENMDTLLTCVKNTLDGKATLKFDPTLVRGMGYYTGTIFEVKLDEYNFSIAGGGRYDEMIGKFSGQKVPACGFSIGFERIITILRDHPTNEENAENEKIAFLVAGGAGEEKLCEIFRQADKLRSEGKTVTVLPLKKNAKFQIDRLMEDGFSKIERIYND